MVATEKMSTEFRELSGLIPCSSSLLVDLLDEVDMASLVSESPCSFYNHTAQFW